MALSSPAFSQPAVNTVVQWNETTMSVIDANGQIAVQSTRTLAMVHAAAHDALNAINPAIRRLLLRGPGDAAASPTPAVAAAAHTVLVGIIGSFGTPAQRGTALALVEQAYTASLARVTDGPARNKGVMVGRAAGVAILTLRKDDGATRELRPTPRAWVPASGGLIPPRRRTRPLRIRTPRAATPPSILPGWGNVTPFTLALVVAVLAAGAAGPGEPDLRARLQRDQGYRRTGEHGPHTRSDRDRPVLVRGPRRLNRIGRAAAGTRNLDAWDSVGSSRS